MEDLYIISIEKVSGDRPSSGMSLDGVFAKISASKFCDQGIDLILKNLKEAVMSPKISDNLKNGEIGNGSYLSPS